MGFPHRTDLDGELVQEAVRRPVSTPFAAAGRKGGDLVLAMVNVSDEPRLVGIEWRGGPRLADSATATVLTSVRTTDENTLDQPGLVAPEVREVTIRPPEWKDTVPAHSLTMLRVPAR